MLPPRSFPVWVAVISLGCMWPAIAEPTHEERMLLNKYKQACAEARPGGEKRMLLCPALERQEAIIATYIRDQISDVCKYVSRECNQASGQARQRISYFSQLIGCSQFSAGCPVHPEGGSRSVGTGDINVVVEMIESIRRTGAPVPPALLFAVSAYMEAKDLNRDLKNSIDQVNAELRRFYSNVEIGCREHPDFPDDPPPNACTARLNRQWQANAVNAAINWNNSNSVIRQTTRAAVERWDLERLRQRARLPRRQ